MDFDKNFLKTLTVLYAEDDEHARNSMKAIVEKIFKKAYIAKDGRQGLELFKKFKDSIDVIISDIRMPHLDGIGFLKGVREITKEIPFIFTTAHQENEYLLDAIKLGVFHYANKPVNIKDVILKVQEACQAQYEKKKAIHNYKEAQLYLGFINQSALISKTDLLGDITFVNELFCLISGYEKDELIGKPHNIIRHPDTPSEIFQALWESIANGETWKGKLKNKDKNGDVFYINANIFPIYDDTDSEIIGYMSISFLTTDEENEKREYKTQIRQLVLESKKTQNELNKKIKELEKKLHDCKHIDVLYDNIDKISSQNKKLIKQLNFYEDKIKEIKKEYLNIQKISKERVLSIMDENKRLKYSNDVMKKEIKHLSTLTSKQESEILTINTQLNKQADIIEDLRDVIAHREDQLKKLGVSFDDQ